MSKNETGGTAFPGLNGVMTGIDSDGIERWETEPSGGMLLRDYFAAKMMPSELDREMQKHEGYNYENAAKRAYKMADAMLEARAK